MMLDQNRSARQLLDRAFRQGGPVRDPVHPLARLKSLMALDLQAHTFRPGGTGALKSAGRGGIIR
jgi:hypothetical protein